ncbi:MAG: transposase [Nitrospirae bacterium]|nr:transposase [Nitrospirota bacterium]
MKGQPLKKQEPLQISTKNGLDSYFVTICCHEARPVFLDKEVADSVQRELEFRNNVDTAAIYCYTLMPNHLHMIVSLQKAYEGNLPKWVSAFKSFTSKTVKKEFGIERLWQTNFYEHVVRNDESLDEIIDYVLNNPVRKGIVGRWEEYPYSRVFRELIR